MLGQSQKKTKPAKEQFPLYSPNGKSPLTKTYTRPPSPTKTNRSSTNLQISNSILPLKSSRFDYRVKDRDAAKKNTVIVNTRQVPGLAAQTGWTDEIKIQSVDELLKLIGSNFVVNGQKYSVQMATQQQISNQSQALISSHSVSEDLSFEADKRPYSNIELRKPIHKELQPISRSSPKKMVEDAPQIKVSAMDKPTEMTDSEESMPQIKVSAMDSPRENTDSETTQSQIKDLAIDNPYEKTQMETTKPQIKVVQQESPCQKTEAETTQLSQVIGAQALPNFEKELSYTSKLQQDMINQLALEETKMLPPIKGKKRPQATSKQTDQALDKNLDKVTDALRDQIPNLKIVKDPSIDEFALEQARITAELAGMPIPKVSKRSSKKKVIMKQMYQPTKIQQDQDGPRDTPQLEIDVAKHDAAKEVKSAGLSIMEKENSETAQLIQMKFSQTVQAPHKKANVVHKKQSDLSIDNEGFDNSNSDSDEDDQILSRYITDIQFMKSESIRMQKAISSNSLQQIPFGDYLMDLKNQLHLDADTDKEFWDSLKQKTQMMFGVQPKEIPEESKQKIQNPEINQIIEVIMATLKDQQNKQRKPANNEPDGRQSSPLTKNSGNSEEFPSPESRNSSKRVRSPSRKNLAQAPILEDLQKVKIQLYMLQLAFKKNKKMEERLMAKINEQAQWLNERMPDFRRLLQQRQRKNKSLHFAFLFACPLILNESGKGDTVPQLNYVKEYAKIKERLAANECQIEITNRQCTVQSLSQILQRKPCGIHFSGHGIQNDYKSVGEYHYTHKDEGDFLLFETENGDSQLISRKQLQKLIKGRGAKIDFVFVASCHSNFTAQIWLQCGVGHVISINHEDAVQDEAILVFTEAFYSLVFSGKKNICDAFKKAKFAVEIQISQKEAKKFLIDYNYDNKDKDGKHACITLGPFPQAMYIEQKHVTPNYMVGCIYEGELIGRQRDTFLLINKILSNKTQNLITLQGLPGVGKSALARKALQFLIERGLLAGGFIFVNIAGIQDTECLIWTFNTTMSKAYPNEFPEEMLAELNSHEILKKILNKIKSTQSEFLIVFDNAQDIIINDKPSFQKFLLKFLSNGKIKVLLTTTLNLKSNKKPPHEYLIYCDELSFETSWQLFAKLSKFIPLAEITELLKKKPNLKKFPEEQKFGNVSYVQKHHLARLMCGNPTQIRMFAQMYSDPEHPITLAGLYDKICDETSQNNDDEEEALLHARNISANLAIKTVMHEDPCSIVLLRLIALLPGGIQSKNLDMLWSLFKGCLNAQKQQADKKNMGSEVEDTSNIGKDSRWQGQYQTLHKNRLIQEKNMGSDSVILFVPQHIRQTVVNQIEEQKAAELVLALSDYFLQEFRELYSLIANEIEKVQEKYVARMKQHDQNFWAFIKMITELQGEQEQSEKSQDVEDLETDLDLEQKLFEKNMKKKPTRRDSEKSQKRASLIKLYADNSSDSADEQQKNQLKELAQDIQKTNEDKHKQKITFIKRKQSRTYFDDFAEKEDKQGNDDEEVPQENEVREKQREITLRLSEKMQGSLRKSSANDLKKQFSFSSKILGLPQKLSSSGKQQSVFTKLQKKLSVFGVSKEVQGKATDALQLITTEELAISYYLTNLVLLEDYHVVVSLITKKILKIKQISANLKGNCLRLQAFSLFELLKAEIEKQEKKKEKQKQTVELQKQLNEIFNCLRKANVQFENCVIAKKKCVKNPWGLALTNYQMIELYLFAHQFASKYSLKFPEEIQLLDLQSQTENQFLEVQHTRGQAMVEKFNLTQNYPNALTQKAQSLYVEKDLLPQVDIARFHSHVNIMSVPQDQYKKKYQSLIQSFIRSSRACDENTAQAELFIKRKQGNRFSLLTEVIRGTPTGGIYPKLKEVISMSREQSEQIDEEDSFESSDDLPSEGQDSQSVSD